MNATKEDLIKRMQDDVVNMDEDDVAVAAREYLDAGYPAAQGVMDGLAEGMNRAGVLFDEEEYYVADILLCSDAMYTGVDVLRPHMEQALPGPGRVGVIGVVAGDTHDIGKNLVKIMLEAAGFTMIDLGRDVPARSFVDAVRTNGASFLCLLTLMTTAMPQMREVISLLEGEGLRGQVGVVIGGGPVSQRFAESIGADAYSTNAVDAVRVVKGLLHVE